MSGYNDMIDRVIQLLQPRHEGTPRIEEAVKWLGLMRPRNDIVEAAAIFGEKTGKPYVELRLAAQVIVQWSPADARHHAMAVLEAAEAAEQDAFMVAYLTERVGGEVPAAIGVLQEYRAFRAAQREKEQ